MAEETLKASEPEVVMVGSAHEVVAPAEKVAVPEKEEEVGRTPVKSVEEVLDPKVEEKKLMAQSVSFKEESNRVADLQDPEKKALDELKKLIRQALDNHEFSPPPPAEPVKEEKVEEEKEEEEEDTVSVVVEEKPEAEPVKVEKAESAEVEKKTEEPVKEEETHEAKSEETHVAEAAPAEAVVVVDEDGAKTVEAIEETIVAVQQAKETEELAASASSVAEEKPVDKKVEEEEEAQEHKQPEEVSIWGVPLLCDDRSDVILLKFLRARDFKVKEAFTMIKNTVQWRKKFGIDELLEQDLGNDLEKVVFMNGFDKEGHPVCYNVYGEFQNKDLYQKMFSDEEKRLKFLQWRIQFLEKSIRKLDFSPGGVSTIVQINDLKNSPGPGKWELRQATNQALNLLQDNYPEFVSKQVFINVPWWYLAFYRMISPFLTQRTKSKFVCAGPSKSVETLFKYVNPEQVPVQYGGLGKEDDKEFTCADPVTEMIVKPSTKQTVEIPVSETCSLVWEIRVVGWDVNYSAEFTPVAEDGYTVIIHKARKISSSSDESVICDSFKIGEPGKVVLTINNTTSKKKKLLFRSKAKTSSSSD